MQVIVQPLPYTLSQCAPQEIAEKAADAYRIADLDDSTLLAQMSGTQLARPLSPAAVLALRIACMRLLTVMMAWEPFRYMAQGSELSPQGPGLQVLPVRFRSRKERMEPGSATSHMNLARHQHTVRQRLPLHSFTPASGVCMCPC